MNRSSLAALARDWRAINESLESEGSRGRKAEWDAEALSAEETREELFVEKLCLKALEIAANEFCNRDIIDWKRVRSAIEHENHLVNQRVTWLLLSQAFLITAFSTMYLKWWELKFGIARTASAAGSLNADSAPPAAHAATLVLPSLNFDYINLPMFLVSGLAIAICLNVFRTLMNASIQLDRLTKWWYSDAFDKLRTDRAGAKELYKARNRQHPHIHLWRGTEVAFLRSSKLSQNLLLRTEFLPIYFTAIWFFMILGVVVPNTSQDWWNDALTFAKTWKGPLGWVFVGSLLTAVLWYVVPTLKKNFPDESEGD